MTRLVLEGPRQRGGFGASLLNAGALALGVATGALLVARLVRRRHPSAPYVPRASALSRAERDALEGAREATGDVEPVVADIDLADRYDRYSG